MLKNLSPILIALAFSILPAVAGAANPDAGDIAVAVHRDGGEIQVDVNFLVDATPQEAWNVLTDYDHMANFVSNVTASRIVGRSNDKLQVAQTLRVKLGPFGMNFDNVRDIEFVPLQEIRSTLVQGDMKSSVFTTSIAAEGNAVRITNHGRFTPNRWVPPLIGPAMMEAETRKQFAEYRAEILRRKNLDTAAPAVRPS